MRVPPRIPLGDPALLLKHILPVPTRSSYYTCMVLHFNDVNEIIPPNIHVLFSNSSYMWVWNTISQCNFVMSSSLHGIIFADVLGVPARWISFPGSRKSEGFFKYCDYFSGSRNITGEDCMNGNGDYAPAFTIKQAMYTGPHPSLKYNTHKLLNAFPINDMTTCNKVCENT